MKIPLLLAFVLSATSETAIADTPSMPTMRLFCSDIQAKRVRHLFPLEFNATMHLWSGHNILTTRDGKQYIYTEAKSLSEENIHSNFSDAAIQGDVNWEKSDIQHAPIGTFCTNSPPIS